MSQQDRLQNKLEKAVAKLPKDQQIAIGMGFYQFDDAFAEQMEGYLGFDNEDEADTPDSTTSVNGEFGTEGNWEGLDNFQDFDGELDEEFDDFSLNKFKRGVKKIGKKIKKGTKKLSINNIKKGLKKLSIKNIVKTVKKAVKDVATFVKKGALFIPRQAARGLIALNFRGFAYKLNWLHDNDKKQYDKLCGKWRDLGGGCSALRSAYRSGYKKKALFCFAKCKKKLADQTSKKKGFLGADGKANYGNYELDTTKLYDIVKSTAIETNVVATGTAVMVGLGGSVIAALGSYLVSVPQTKAMKQQIKNDKEKNDKELELMAKQQGITKGQMDKQLDLAQQKVTDELNPINQILNNPNLTEVQKKAAIVEVNKALDTTQKRSMKKYIMFGAIGLVVVLGMVWALKKK